MPAKSVFDVGPNATHSAPFSAQDAARLAARAAARYYDRAHQFRFEPLKSFDQFLVLCLIIAICFSLLYYWRTVIKCCLGDDKIRIDRFQCVYWLFFQCCGCCDGEWTRCISWSCCCCHPRWRGRNLKRLVGETLGLIPVSVRLQNIVVGGLPQDRSSWFPRKPSLFLQVIPDETSPTLNTEVVTEANTECVQFTSSLTMLVKNNPSDDPVRFIVKEMLLTGSKEIADCSVNPARLVLWAQRGRKMRIQLGGSSRYSDPLSMPWILLDLSIPLEAKYLRKQVGVFAPVISTSSERGSTAERSAVESEYTDDPTVGLFCGQQEERGFVDLPMTNWTGFVAIHDAGTFKDSYPLVNDKGAMVIEDRDMAAQALLNTRSCANLAAGWLFGILVLFLLLRILTSGCLEEFKVLEAMRLYSVKRNEPFKPESPALARAVYDICNFQMLNLEIFEHILHTKRAPEVHKECFPPLSYRRCATIKNVTTPVMLGLPCPAHACSFDYDLEDHEPLIYISVLICIIGICLRKLWEQYTLNHELILPRKPSSPRMSSRHS